MRWAPMVIPSPLEAGRVVEALTDVGVLYLHAEDLVMTPSIAATGRWEEPEARWLRSVLRPGQTMLDCGANVGYFTLLAAEAVGPSGSVLAVEPEPRNFRVLAMNVWRNGAGNVTVLPVAGGEHRGAVALRLSEENRGDHQTHETAEAQDLLVPSLALDELFEDGERLDVVKIDTQGSDYLILRGLRQTLTRHPEAQVLVEFWLDGMLARGVSADDILAEYRGLGREVFLLEIDGGTRRCSDAEIKDAAMHQQDHWVDLVLR